VIALVIVGVFFLGRNWDRRHTLGKGELPACEVVLRDPDDTRSLVRLQVGESHSHPLITAVCTPKAQNVRLVIETASGDMHLLFAWPEDLECKDAAACQELDLGCGGEFQCTDRGADGCIAGSCREAMRP
jgi:hypothetical protein